jgi:hypothetical protein
MSSMMNRVPAKLAVLGFVGVIGLSASGCSDNESDAAGSLTSMASDVAIGDSIAATYFNAERFEDGTGTELQGDNDEIGTSWPIAESEMLLGNPFNQSVVLAIPDLVLFDLADVEANYDTTIGGGDASVWLGDFDPATIEERAADLASGDSFQARRFAEQPRDVTDERYIQLRDDVGAEQVVGVERDDSALGIDGVEETTTTLDDHDAYAAVLLLQGTDDDVSFDGDATLDAGWEHAGLAAGFEDGEQYVSTVLWHSSEDDAQANAAALADVMSEHAGCADGADVDVTVDGFLVYASCPAERAMWASTVQQRYPGFPPLFGTLSES